MKRLANGGERMKPFKLGLLMLGMIVPASGAYAITFSNILINNLPATGTPFGPNGITFTIPNHFLVGIGFQTLQIDYRVDATPGNFLTGFDMFPVGNSRNGTVDIQVDHSNGGIESHLYSVTSGSSLISLPSQTNIALSGTKTFYDVTTTIDLTGIAANSVNTVSLYSVSYAEAVPEPATMAAVAFGLTALAARRRKEVKR